MTHKIFSFVLAFHLYEGNAKASKPDVHRVSSLYRLLKMEEASHSGMEEPSDNYKNITTEQRNQKHGKLCNTGVHVHDSETTRQELLAVPHESTLGLSSRQQILNSYTFLVIFISIIVHRICNRCL